MYFKGAWSNGSVYRALVGKPEGKRPRRRSRLRGGDNKIDHTETGLDGMDWINLALDREKRQALMHIN